MKGHLVNTCIISSFQKLINPPISLTILCPTWSLFRLDETMGCHGYESIRVTVCVSYAEFCSAVNSFIRTSTTPLTALRVSIQASAVNVSIFATSLANSTNNVKAS